VKFIEFLEKEDPAYEIFRACLSIVFDKGDGVTEHIERLSNESKIVYLLWCFDGEIHNGGFDQLFTNSLGNHCQEILEGLTIVGAETSSKLLSQAMSWFPNSAPSTDRMERWNQREIFGESQEYEREPMGSSLAPCP
jgi:hypothetical protein